MSFVQFKLDRSIDQSRRIFNKYIYETPDTMAQVLVVGYFAASRFVTIDAPDTTGMGWIGGIIECECSDGYFIGRVQADAGTIVNVADGGGFDSPLVRVEATANYSQTDKDDVIYCNGTFDVNLISEADATKDISIKNVGSGTITIVPDGGESTEITSLTSTQGARLSPRTGVGWLAIA